MVRLDLDLTLLNENGEKIPVFFEGDAPAELPDEFFTVSEDYTSTSVSANNAPREHLYEFTLKWYTKHAKRLYSGLWEAIRLLASKGYDVGGVGYNNGTYQTLWYSRMVEIEKIDFLEE